LPALVRDGFLVLTQILTGQSLAGISERRARGKEE
jgi:hypothetical protein